MSLYEPFHQFGMWGDTFQCVASPNIGSSALVQLDDRLEKKSEYISHESMEPSRRDQEENKPAAKIQRRLAQNREAARKSRLRKKAYVQQLETSRLKLAQLEQELERTRHQGVHVGSAIDGSRLEFSGNVNPAITAFEMEYGHWVEEQNRQISELRNALQAHITDTELRILVESGLNHYCSLFRMKADVAKADVFYLLSGTWRTSTEHFFQWIGGFRPSELLNILIPHLEPFTEQQLVDVGNLQHSSRQAEDALTQGMDKLQENLGQTIAADQWSQGIYQSEIFAIMEKLEAVEGFVNQADHLRQQTMQQMSRILTTRQAARALLALGEYLYRLRALSSLWAACPHKLAYSTKL